MLSKLTSTSLQSSNQVASKADMKNLDVEIAFLKLLMAAAWLCTVAEVESDMGSVEIAHSVSLKFDGGKFLAIPETLLVKDDEGNDYLKLSATNYVVNALICGKAAKNASLSNGPKMTELKNLRNEKIQPTSFPEDPWQEGEDSEAVEPNVKKRRCVQGTVDVDIHGTSVTLLVPAKRAMVSDIMVKLDAVFKFLKPDCLEKTESRGYKKTGQFKKGSSEGEYKDIEK